MVAMINITITIVTVGSFLGTHLTAFDTVNQSRVRIPLETSCADNSLQRKGKRGQIGLGLGGSHLFVSTTFNHPTSSWIDLYQCICMSRCRFPNKSKLSKI